MPAGAARGGAVAPEAAAPGRGAEERGAGPGAAVAVCGERCRRGLPMKIPDLFKIKPQTQTQTFPARL